ncbi:MAG: hypothetical protein HRT80_16535 [Henriciella sp.]|nr:hypothetical protein [Henriciella sp.]
MENIETDFESFYLLYGFGPTFDSIAYFAVAIMFAPLTRVPERPMLSVTVFTLLAGLTASYATTDFHEWSYGWAWATGLLAAIFYFGANISSIIAIIIVGLIGTLFRLSFMVEPSDFTEFGFTLDFGLSTIILIALLASCLLPLRARIWDQAAPQFGTWPIFVIIFFAAGIGQISIPFHGLLTDLQYSISDRLSEMWIVAQSVTAAYAQDATVETSTIVVTGTRTFTNPLFEWMNTILLATVCLTLGAMRPQHAKRMILIGLVVVGISQLFEGIDGPYNGCYFTHMVQVHEYLAVIVFVTLGAKVVGARVFGFEPAQAKQAFRAAGTFLAPKRPKSSSGLAKKWSVLSPEEFRSLRKTVPKNIGIARDIVADAERSPLRIKLSEVYYASRGAAIFGIFLVKIIWALQLVSQDVYVTAKMGVSAIIVDFLTTTLTAFIVPVIFLVTSSVAAFALYPLGLKGKSSIKTVRQLYLVMDGTTGYIGQTIAAYAAVLGARLTDVVDVSTGEMVFSSELLGAYTQVLIYSYNLLVAVAIIALIPANLFLVPWRTSKLFADISGLRRSWSIAVHALLVGISGYVTGLLFSLLIFAIMFSVPWAIDLFL